VEGARGVPLAFAVEIVDIYCPRPRRNRRSSTRSTGLPMNVFTLRMAVLLNVISIGLSSAPEEQMPYWSNRKWRVVPGPL